MTELQTAVEAQTDKHVAAQSLLKRSVCLILKCHYLGNEKGYDLANVDIKMRRAAEGETEGKTLDREKKQLRAIKPLFDSKQLQPCNSAIDAVKAGLKALSVDGGLRIFGAGAYLIPLVSVSKAETVLLDGQATLAIRAQELAGRRDVVLAAREQDMGPLFDASDYPTADEIIDAYSIDWTYASFNAPEMLMEVDRVAYERAVADNQGRMAQAFDDAIAGVRATALNVCKEVVVRLTPGDDGKVKVIQKGALKNLQDLVDALPALNSVGDDDGLMLALAKVGALAEGLDGEVLRKADAVRVMVLDAAKEAVAQLDGLIKTGGRRAISFGTVEV